MCFSVCIQKNPIGKWDESQGDHHLGFNLNGKDFDELNNLLDIKLPSTKKSDYESYDEYDERLKSRYFEAVTEAGYKMLGRISDCYKDVIYLPFEVNHLLEECLKLKKKTQKKDALSALRKLIFVCNEAIKTDSGIFLGSD